MKNILLLIAVMTLTACEQNISSTSTGGGAEPVVNVLPPETEKEESENEQTI